MLETLPSIGQFLSNSVLTIIISTTVGALTSFTYWTKTAQEKRNEEDNQEKKIKALLNEQIRLQDGKIEDLQNQIDEAHVEVGKLKEHQRQVENENQYYLKIFQGRDEDEIKYREEGRIAMAKLEENVRLSNIILEEIKQNDKKFNEILKQVQNIYSVLAERHLESERKRKQK